MKKKKNILKRNSGFIVGCLLAAVVSFFTADAVMTKDLASLLLKPDEKETQQESDGGTAETLAPEVGEDRVFETDPFTVTASGNVIKGVESEVPQQKQTESETSEEDGIGEESALENGEGSSDNGSTDAGIDDGSGDGSSSGDGSGDGGYSSGDGDYGDGSYGDGGYSDGSYEQPIEIQDPGNGSYSYDGGSGDNISVSDNGGGGSASTPDDVIIQGISSRYIGEEELYNYDLGQLRLIRNEIFALHGRIFDSQDLRDYFSQKSWYVPTYSPEEFDANMFYYLNDYEEANLNVIMNYEAALGGY